jgi:hypothetical protein
MTDLLPTLFRSSAATPSTPYSAVWYVDAPWAHPLWRQYALFLVDLTTETGTPPLLYAQGVTHEVDVWAVDPKLPVTDIDDRNTAHLLTPQNHGYQFRAESDAAAEARIADLVRRIELRDLSPDTDFIRTWDAIFADGASLRHGHNRPADGVYQ